MISAKIICDSISPGGERLTTVEVEFHRFILPELNTHRVFSRNYQSSRAIPVQKMIDQVRENPAIPVHWGKNQAGMQADGEQNTTVFIEHYEKPRNCHDMGGVVREPYTVQGAWERAAYEAANVAQGMHDAGYHKQVVNRLLEPFMWTKGIITADQKGWDSFFKLRCHPAAQPEIQELAYKIQEAVDLSEPQPLEYGDWHLPYYKGNYGDGVWKDCGYAKIVDGKMYSTDHKKFGSTLGEAIKISTSCTAQVSYRKLDDSLEKAIKIYDMLNLPEDGVYPENPPHFSPAEHVAKCIEPRVFRNSRSGNFNCDEWYQYRKALETGQEKGLIG